MSSRERHFFVELLKPNPNPIVIMVSIVIVLVGRLKLKAPFVPPSPSFQLCFRPTAPDGQPPLAFILDSAEKSN